MIPKSSSSAFADSASVYLSSSCNFFSQIYYSGCHALLIMCNGMNIFKVSYSLGFAPRLTMNTREVCLSLLSAVVYFLHLSMLSFQKHGSISQKHEVAHVNRRTEHLH